LRLEVSRRDHSYYSVQEVRVLFEKQTNFLFSSSFKSLSVFLRDTVPEFRLTPVMVVDRS
jgi:hypothetical protein